MAIVPMVNLADQARPAIYLICFLAQIIIIIASFANERIADRIEFEAKSGDVFLIEYGRVNEPSHENTDCSPALSTPKVPRSRNE
jgi:hypothetical protein